MKYAMYYGGKKILPPDNVKQIYHGPNLIWERKSGKKISIKKIFEATLEDYRFTRAGLIIPRHLYAGDEHNFYDITGKSGKFTIPSEMALSGGGSFVFADKIMYRADDAASVCVTSEDGMSFEYTSLTPAISDTRAQWSNYQGDTGGAAIYNHVHRNPTTYGDYAAGGIYPFTRPFAYMKGGKELTNLCYMSNGKVISDAGFFVLSVNENSMVCADNVTITGGYATGRITERDLKGTEKRVLKESWAFATYAGNAMTSAEGRGGIMLLGDMLVYETRENYTAKLIFESATDGTIYSPPFYAEPDGVMYVNGVYYAQDNADWSKIYVSEDGIQWIAEPVKDESGTGYSLYGAGMTPGAMCSINGACYVFGDTGKTDESGKKVYSVLRIQYGEA